MKFNDFEKAIQRRFLNISIRVVYLDEGTTIRTRQEIFKRINSGGRYLVPSEERRGSYLGVFKDFLEKCVKNELFNELAPRTRLTEKRYEGFELATRFFAYLNNYENQYKNYDGRVREYFDDYIKKENIRLKENQSELESKYYNEFKSMLKYAKKLLDDKEFKKTEKSRSTPRARFEASSTGIALALRERPNLKIQNIEWLDSKGFSYHTRSDAANNKSRLIGRIEYVKTQLLKGD